MKNDFKNLFLLLICFFSIVGCNDFFSETSPTEKVVKFKNLPFCFKDSCSYTVIDGGEKFYIFPWEKIYRFDTSVKSICLNKKLNQHALKKYKNFIQIRLSDGNFILIKAKAEFQILREKKDLINFVKYISNSNLRLNKFVKEIIIYQLENFLGSLTSEEFLDSRKRNQNINLMLYSTSKKLKRYGIFLLNVSLEDYKFNRILDNGLEDISYQDKINEIKHIKKIIIKEKKEI